MCVVDAAAVDQVALPLPVVGVEVRERINPAPVSLRITSDVGGTTFGKRCKIAKKSHNCDYFRYFRGHRRCRGSGTSKSRARSSAYGIAILKDILLDTPVLFQDPPPDVIASTRHLNE